MAMADPGAHLDLQGHEGLLPNLDLAAINRQQLQAAFPDRFFPCSEQTDTHDHIETASQLHRDLTAEQIAALQQGSAAWHLGRCGRITGSTIADLLGFDCPLVNRLLAGYQVYHAAKDAKQGVEKLRAAVARLRGEKEASADAASMGAFGQLCCEWGNRHEAAGLHTLLSYAPPGSCLIDSGFVCLTPQLVADNPAFYQDILAPSGSNSSSGMGSLGSLDASLFSTLSIGCSVDGLLAVPKAGTMLQPLVGEGEGVRRAPPYTWMSDAGYQVAVVEVKCPTPFYPVGGKPWAFGVRGSSGYRPYKCMKAHYYCQAQLNMLVTGTELCVFVVWTRTRTWLLHIPVNKPWLHAMLHLLKEVHTRYVATPLAAAAVASQQQQQQQQQKQEGPSSSSGSSSRGGSAAGVVHHLPVNLFWCDAEPAVRNLYRRFVTRTAQLCVLMCSNVLPDPLFPACGPRTLPQQQQQQQGQQHQHLRGQQQMTQWPQPQPHINQHLLHQQEQQHQHAYQQQHQQQQHVWAQGLEAPQQQGQQQGQLHDQPQALHGQQQHQQHQGLWQQPSQHPGQAQSNEAHKLQVYSSHPGAPPQAAAAAAAAPTGHTPAGFMPQPGWNCCATQAFGACGTAAAQQSGDVTAGTSAAAAAAAVSACQQGPPAALVGCLAPPGWQSGHPAAVSGPAAPCWVHDSRLGLYHAMVRSVHLPWNKQHTLQRDRWFLERCDPDDPRQPDMQQAWLAHPLLDALAAQPQAMATLLYRMHQAAPPAASAPAGSAQQQRQEAWGGGLSPGRVLLTMLFKMEQLNGLQLQPVWQQLPPCTQRTLHNMRQTLMAAASSSSSRTARTTAAAAAGPLAAGGPTLMSPSLNGAEAASVGLWQDGTVQAPACSLGTLWGLRRQLGCRGLGMYSTCTLNPCGSFLAPSSSSTLWQQAGIRNRGGDSRRALHTYRESGESSSKARAANGRKRAAARRLLAAAQRRQQALAAARYRQVVLEWRVVDLLQHHAADLDWERVGLQQPLYLQVQQLLQQAGEQQDLADRAAEVQGMLMALQQHKRVQMLLQQRQQQRRQQERRQQEPRREDSDTEDRSLEAGSRGAGVLTAGVVASSLLQTGNYANGGMQVGKTGRKVFKRIFLSGSSQCLDHAAAAAAAAAAAGDSTVADPPGTGGVAVTAAASPPEDAGVAAAETRGDAARSTAVQPASAEGAPAAACDSDAVPLHLTRAGELAAAGAAAGITPIGPCQQHQELQQQSQHNEQQQQQQQHSVVGPTACAAAAPRGSQPSAVGLAAAAVAGPSSSSAALRQAMAAAAIVAQRHRAVRPGVIASTATAARATIITGAVFNPAVQPAEGETAAEQRCDHVGGAVASMQGVTGIILDTSRAASAPATVPAARPADVLAPRCRSVPLLSKRRRVAAVQRPSSSVQQDTQQQPQQEQQQAGRDKVSGCAAGMGTASLQQESRSTPSGSLGSAQALPGLVPAAAAAADPPAVAAAAGSRRWRVPAAVAGGTPTVVGWCNLGSIAAAAAAGVSWPGARGAAAAAAVASEWHTAVAAREQRFRALLRSRSTAGAAGRRRCTAPGGGALQQQQQQQSQLTNGHQQAAQQLQQQLEQQQHAWPANSSPATADEDTDAELEELLATGALDELLDQPRERLEAANSPQLAVARSRQ